MNQCRAQLNAAIRALDARCPAEARACLDQAERLAGELAEGERRAVARVAQVLRQLAEGVA